MTLVLMLIDCVLLSFSRLLAERLQGYRRLAFANIYRRKAQNMMQINVIVFSNLSIVCQGAVKAMVAGLVFVFVCQCKCSQVVRKTLQ